MPFITVEVLDSVLPKNVVTSTDTFVKPAHPFLSLGNWAEGIAGLFAIGAGVLVVMTIPGVIAAWLTLGFAITTTAIAFMSAWHLWFGS